MLIPSKLQHKSFDWKNVIGVSLTGHLLHELDSNSEIEPFIRRYTSTAKKVEPSSFFPVFNLNRIQDLVLFPLDIWIIDILTAQPCQDSGPFLGRCTVS